MGCLCLKSLTSHRQQTLSNGLCKIGSGAFRIVPQYIGRRMTGSLSAVSVFGQQRAETGTNLKRRANRPNLKQTGSENLLGKNSQNFSSFRPEFSVGLKFFLLSSKLVSHGLMTTLGHNSVGFPPNLELFKVFKLCT